MRVGGADLTAERACGRAAYPRRDIRREKVNGVAMERERAEVSLHTRLMGACARGARAQEHSRALLEAHSVLHERVVATLASIRTRRERDTAADSDG
jgi:hypothetical protein